MEKPLRTEQRNNKLVAFILPKLSLHFEYYYKTVAQIENMRICIQELLRGRLLSQFLAPEHWPRLKNYEEKHVYHCFTPQF